MVGIENLLSDIYKLVHDFKCYQTWMVSSGYKWIKHLPAIEKKV